MTTALDEHAFRVELEAAFEAALEQTRAALTVEGFGVITEIDVRATLADKLAVDFRRYTILGACNPALAHRALASDLGIGLLLPCNVTVHQADDGRGSVVSLIDPISLLGGGGTPELQDVAREAHERLARVADALGRRD